MSDILEVLNITGHEINPEEWKTGAKKTALNVAKWLADRQCAVAISLTNDGVVVLDFAYNGKMQPTLCIAREGSVVWPKGSDFDLMMAFMEGK